MDPLVTHPWQDRAMLAELKSTWDAKASAHEERKAMRSKELLALQERGAEPGRAGS